MRTLAFPVLGVPPLSLFFRKKLGRFRRSERGVRTVEQTLLGTDFETGVEVDVPRLGGVSVTDIDPCDMAGEC